MAIYNWFGLEYTDIVNAFRGAVAGDFGGQTVIEAEMDLAEAEVVQMMSQQANAMLQSVEYMEIPQITGTAWTTPFPVLQDFYIFVVDRYNPAIGNYISPIPGICLEGTCQNFKKELDSTYLFTDYTITGSNLTFGTTFDQDSYTYYTSYTINTADLVLPSVKGMIRDRVACVLGMQLYSKGDDTWKLVELYCDRSKIKMIDDKWLPAEFRKYKWLNSPFRGGITSIPISRS